MGIRYEEFEPLLIVLAFGVLGVVMAMIIKTLYDDGIIIPAYLTGTLTISSLMTGIVILFLMVGVVVAAMKGR